MCDENLDKQKKYLVAKSNVLVQKSKISLTLSEQKIINYMISRLSPYQTEFEYITINYNDFCRLLNIQNTNFTYTKKIVENLYSKFVSICDGKSYVPLKWLEDYIINENEISLLFHFRMKDLLLNLIKDGKFTQTELLYYLRFKNKYSGLIYDYLRSYINLKFRNKSNIIERILTLDEFKEKFGIENKYNLYADIKRYVLEPSKKEINFITDISFDYLAIKNGRKVVSLKFTVSVRASQDRLITNKFLKGE